MGDQSKDYTCLVPMSLLGLFRGLLMKFFYGRKANSKADAERGAEKNI